MRGIKFINGIVKDAEITSIITKRDIASKHKGSKLGQLWSVINPIIMLMVYTIVFSAVFKARWSTEINSESSTLIYGMNLFCGLTVYNIFSEVAGRATTLVTSNPNYVKKIKFPLHSLGEMATYSALYQGASNTLILLVMVLIVNNSIPVTIILLPIIWGPLVLNCLGISWILSTIGVYAKDITQVVNAGLSALMFMTPIFYPIESLPNKLQWIATINPIATTIANTRQIALAGEVPDFLGLLVEYIGAVLWCEITYRILITKQREFADLL